MDGQTTDGGFMKKAVSFFESIPAFVLLFINFSLVLLLGIVDWLTGPEIGFFIFYPVPIAIGVWFSGKKTGLLLSFFSILIWIAADLAGGRIYSSPVIPVWNTVMLFLAYLAFTWFLDRLKRNVSRIHQQEMRLQKKQTVIQTSQQITALMAEHIGARNLEILKWINRRKESGHQVSRTVETASRKIGSCLHALTEVSYLDPFIFNSAENINSHVNLLRARLTRIQDEFHVHPAEDPETSLTEPPPFPEK